MKKRYRTIAIVAALMLVVAIALLYLNISTGYTLVYIDKLSKKERGCRDGNIQNRESFRVESARMKECAD